MIGYRFKTSGPVHRDLLSALGWAVSSHLEVIELSGEIQEENRGLIAENMVTLKSVKVPEVLQNFARRCAYRTLSTFSGSNFASSSLNGAWAWLNTNKVTPETWENMVQWAKENRMMWMEGGHAEAAICNAILAHVNNKDAHYHAWMAAEHTKRLCGHKETVQQKRSIVQAINKRLEFA